METEILVRGSRRKNEKNTKWKQKLYSHVEVILLVSNSAIAPISSNIIPCRRKKLIELILYHLNFDLGNKTGSSDPTGHSRTL